MIGHPRHSQLESCGLIGFLCGVHCGKIETMATRSVSASQLGALLPRGPLGHPAYATLADQLRLLIIDGRLVVDERLPSERELALRLSLSRTTVAACYARLREAGYLRARRGAGNYVTLPRRRAATGFLPGSFRAGEHQIGWNCASGAATAGVAAAYGRAIERLPEVLSGSGYLPDGLDDLRQRLSAWYDRRGLPTDPDQIVVTTGALSAFAVVVSTLLGRGDRLLLESPTYSNAIEATRRAGLRPVGYPLPDRGWQAMELARTLDQTRARAAYLIVDQHNPTGICMDERTRLAVAGELHRRGVPAVVDETLVELGLDAPTPAPFATFLPGAISLGSASKAFWGGLRVGWIRAPRSLVRRLVETRAALDLGTAPLEQLVLAELLRDPDAALQAQRDRLRLQRDHLIELLHRTLPDWEFRRPPGGLSLWVQLPSPASSRLAEAAEARGLVVTPGHRFFVDGGGERHLRLPFTHPVPVLDEAVERLSQAWREIRYARPAVGRPTSTIDLSA
jgi:DNA-binding transcriptional MocR family regulator